MDKRRGYTKEHADSDYSERVRQEIQFTPRRSDGTFNDHSQGNRAIHPDKFFHFEIDRALLPAHLADLIFATTKNNTERETSYQIASYCYKHPFQNIIIPVAQIAGKRQTVCKAINSIIEAGIIERIYQGRSGAGASEYRFRDIEKAYTTAKGVYHTYKEAREGKIKRQQSYFDSNIQPAVKETLKSVIFEWDSVPAFQILNTLPDEKKIQTFPYIAGITSGRQSPSWKTAETGRLYCYSPALQTIRKDFRRPEVIARGADLYEVDFIFQHGNIARILTGKKPDIDLSELLNDKRKELKPVIQGILHGQHKGQYLHNTRETYFEKTGKAMTQEQTQEAIALYNQCYSMLYEQIQVKFNTRFAFILQSRGADILLYTLTKAQTIKGIVLPLHDGILCRGRETATQIYELFREASYSIMGAELPCKMTPI